MTAEAFAAWLRRLFGPPEPHPAELLVREQLLRAAQPAGPVWVRWQEFGGFTPWVQAAWRPCRDGEWLIVVEASGLQRWVPVHTVRGEVQVIVQETKPDA